MSRSLSLFSLLLCTLAVPSTANDAPPPLEIIHTNAPLPVPTAAQLKYQGSISALIHFNMATFFHDVRIYLFYRELYYFPSIRIHSWYRKEL